MICDLCHERRGVHQIVTVVGEVKQTQNLCEECFESKRYSSTDTKVLREYRMLFEVGGIVLLFALVGLVGSRAPVWFNLSYLVMIVPSVCAGALLRTRHADA
jgi:hypothetical protein